MKLSLQKLLGKPSLFFTSRGEVRSNNGDEYHPSFFYSETQHRKNSLPRACEPLDVHEQDEGVAKSKSLQVKDEK